MLIVNSENNVVLAVTIPYKGPCRQSECRVIFGEKLCRNARHFLWKKFDSKNNTKSWVNNLIEFRLVNLLTILVN